MTRIGEKKRKKKKLKKRVGGRKREREIDQRNVERATVNTSESLKNSRPSYERVRERDRLEASLLTHCLQWRIANLTARTRCVHRRLENSTRLEYPRLKYSAVKLAANASDDYIHRSSLLYATNRMKTCVPGLKLFRLCRVRVPIYLFSFFSFFLLLIPRFSRLVIPRID